VAASGGLVEAAAVPARGFMKARPSTHRTQYIMYYVCKFEILIAILPKAVAVTAESLTHPSSFSLVFPPKVPTPYVPYAHHYNPLLIRNPSEYLLTIYKARILRKMPFD
jgi:hypothetical protein